jgi:tetratricopeptide (TPR) repeat protein
MMKIALICLAAWATLCPGASLTQGQNDLARRILASTLATDYSLASKQADTLSASKRDAGSFFRNMILLSRFDDLGDTLDLLRSQAFLDTVKIGDPFWENLRLFQLGYVKTELKQTVSGVLTTRKAAKGFATMGTLEARAFYAIYDYYMQGTTAWVPFKTDNRPRLLQTLDSAAKGNNFFWPLFATSLAWMHFDRKDYAAGLRITEFALVQYPRHPVYTQMKADMLFRLGRTKEAIGIYESSVATYAKRAPNSVRWWSGAGNLLRMYSVMGDSVQVKKWKQCFSGPRFQKVRPWMPPSLMKALENQNLLP